MTPAVLVLSAIALANATVGAYVWRHRPSSAANWSFALLAATVALWTAGIAFTHHGVAYITTFTRFTFASASLIPLAILLFFHAFPNETHLQIDRLSKLFILLAGIFTLLSATPAIVRSADLHTGLLQVDYGILYPVYGFYVCTCLVWSFSIFFARYFRATGLTRLQFRYFALSLFLSGAGVTTTNLLVPLLSHDSHYGQYGPYFGLIFLVSTAHLLIRHRFLNIRLALRQSATLLLAFIVCLGVLTLSIQFLAAALRLHLAFREILLLVFAAAAVGVILQPLRAALSRLLDSYTYRTHPDYPKTLRTASDALTRILDLDSVASLVVRTALQAVRAERVAIFIRNGADFVLTLEQSYLPLAPTSSPPRIAATSALAKHLRSSRDAVVTEELFRRSSAAFGPLFHELHTSQLAASVPILSEQQLIGILALGPKLSGDPFFPEDLAFLSTIAGQAATAIANANLYQQVVLINEYLHNILRTMESGVIAVSKHQTITLFNAAAETMTGLSRHAAINNRSDFLPRELREPLVTPLSTGRPLHQFETTLVDSRKRLIPVVCSSSPLRDRRGAILGAVLVFSDLTRLKHLEAEKQQAERLASLGALASGIAHEIKNPLVAIKTFAELLPDRFTDDDFRNNFSRVVTTEIDRIDELIAKLSGLAISPRPSSTPVDIRAPLEDTLTLLRAQFAQHNISVQRNFNAEHPVVLGDFAQLKQLFLNIFLNAIQSMAANGTLTITLSSATSSSARRLLLDITDSGSGIPPAILPQIFEPFVTTKVFGSGLGLAICRNIADIHRAIITASNNLDSTGATISLDFPLYDSSAPDEAATAPPTGSVRQAFTRSHSSGTDL